MKFFVALLFVAFSLCEASTIYPKRVANINRIRLIPEKESFIVGGQETTIANFPHQLGLLDLNVGSGPAAFICGASAISSLFALSAAHCLEFRTPANRINLQGGSTSRISGNRIFFVTRYVNHPRYNTRTLDNDISVIHVDPNTPLTGTNVVPIAIPPICNSDCCGVCVTGNDVTVTGWGIYNMQTRQLPENLQMLSKGIVALATCDRIWGGIQSNKFCTVAENGKDSCNGDSGSPVIRNGVQVGIVSFGSEICGDGSAPAVYVRLEAPIIRNFINEQTGL